MSIDAILGKMNVDLFSTIDSVQRYFPKQLEPSQLWVNYNAEADSLTIYFTGRPVPSVWEDVDQYAYVGFALDDETSITGVMIEHFSNWLLAPRQPKQALQRV